MAQVSGVSGAGGWGGWRRSDLGLLTCAVDHTDLRRSPR